MKMVELSFSAMFTRYTFKFLIIAVISCHFTNSYEYQPGIVNPVLNDDPIDDQESNQHLDTSILQEPEIAKYFPRGPWDPVNEIQELEEIEWPNQEYLRKLGQIAGLAADKNDTLFVFHRGNHHWGYGYQFDEEDHQKHRDNGAIKNDTVIIMNTKTGQVIKSWGADSFYMPHGISLDSDGNVWLTDVVRHQVFRYKRDSYSKPDLVLGEAFIPGRDDRHFCMPTDVVVSTSGIVYISDGYCNSRILIVSSQGELLDEIGLEEGMSIPHSLALLENENLICVADRENRRILCFTAGLDGDKPGVLMRNVLHPRLNRIFSIDNWGRTIYALGIDDDPTRSEAIALDIVTESPISTFAPASGFREPHDLTVSPDGQYIYISDMSPEAAKNIYKFKQEI